MSVKLIGVGAGAALYDSLVSLQVARERAMDARLNSCGWFKCDTCGEWWHVEDHHSHD